MSDPGPGPLELSIRLPRGALKRIAVLRRTSGTVLLRRMIAAHLEPRESPSRTSPADARSSVAPSMGREATYLFWMRLPEPAFGLVPIPAARPIRLLSIVTEVHGYRSLEQIGRAIQQGGGVTGEELIRWQAVHQRG